jgi:cytochrome c biogenesis protein CcdA
MKHGFSAADPLKAAEESGRFSRQDAEARRKRGALGVLGALGVRSALGVLGVVAGGRRFGRGAAFAWTAALVCAAVFGARADMKEQARLDLFFSPGCTECERVKREVFPELQSWFEGSYELVSHDMTLVETIPLLTTYQERCGNKENGRVSIVVDHTVFLSGYETIATGLVDQVGEALEARQNPDWKAPLPPGMDEGEGREAVRRRADSLTWLVIIGGGLLDGINPCAISTLIFFMSVLVISKATRRTRLLVGLSFISASFVVYTALGLGFLYAFRRAPDFPLVKRVAETLLGVAMLPLAGLSFRDALRFRKSQRPDDVALQIPKNIKDRIHRFMNSRLGWGGPVLGGLATGAVVTVLESVCTGQSYLPVLTYMLREGQVGFLRFFQQLIIYNFCFVLPLILVFIAFHQGVDVKTFIAWSKRNLVVAKILLGLFFAAMAVIFLWPALRSLLT